MSIGARSLVLGWIHGGNVRAEFMDSVLGTIWADPATSRLISRYETFSAGAHLAAARNQIAAQFLAKGTEPWLWMLDTDIVFEPELLLRLAATADTQTRPLVTGLYFTTTTGGLPLVPMIYDHEPSGTPEFTPCQDWAPGTVVKVGGCGAGCLLIHRRVLKAIGGEWFSEVTGQGRLFGEDLSFCIRAIAAGFTIHADTGARAGHVKSAIVGLPGTALDGVPARQLAGAANAS
jgi:GT2 family glycosyltransferase